MAFAASGGLDSCTITKWLTEHGVTVVCFTADMAQPDESDFAEVEKRMRACGASDFIARSQDSIAEAGLEIIQAQACYEGRYWNTTGIGRHVIVAGMVPGDAQERASTSSATVRPAAATTRSASSFAPTCSPRTFRSMRRGETKCSCKRFGGRSEMIDYCNERKLPIKASKDAPYSTDANLLGSDARGRQARIAGNRPVVHHAGHGGPAKGCAGQAGNGDDSLRAGPARRD